MTPFRSGMPERRRGSATLSGDTKRNDTMFATVIQQIKALTKDEDGAVAVEYALIGALVALGLTVALGSLATGISGTITRIVTALG